MVKQILENIKRIRRQKGYSQTNIADDLGIEMTTYGKIENGKIHLKVEMLERIAKILQVKVSEIYPALIENDTIIEGKFKIVKLEQNFETYKASQNEA